MLAAVFASYRTERPEKKRNVILLSILAGFLGSIISAVLRSIPNYINRTKFAFWSMVPVAFSFLFLLILLLFGTKSKNKKSILHENLFSAAVCSYTVFSIFYYLPVIITLSAALVNYGESAVSTLVLFRLIGYLLGILFVILTSLAIYKTLIKLSDVELKIAVTGALCILGITQIVVILQRLYSLRIIPKNSFIFAFIAAVVNNGNFFIFAVILFIMLPPILLWKKNLKITEAYANNAQLRKIKAQKRNARRWSKFSLALLLVSVFSLSFLRYYVDREIIHMRFIAIKKSEGAYGIGLDACDICGPSGYFERNGEVVCKLCDVVMNKGTIGFPGGCNPVPVPYIIHDGKIKIKLSDLEAESHRFK